MWENMLEAVQLISVRLYSDVRLFVRDASVRRMVMYDPTTHRLSGTPTCK